MKKSYKTPGIYIRESNQIPDQITGVSTAIPAFIGYTEKAIKNEYSLLLKPTKISSLREYENYFGNASPEIGISLHITDEYRNGRLIDRSADIKLPDPDKRSKFLMYYSLQMFFANGGRDCCIISVGDYSNEISRADLGMNGGLKALRDQDEPTIIVFPDSTGISNAPDYYGLYEESLEQCRELQDRFTIMDTNNEEPGFEKILRNHLQLGPEYLSYGAVYYPWLQTSIRRRIDTNSIEIEHIVTGSPDKKERSGVKQLRQDIQYLLQLPEIKRELDNFLVTLPPSSAMAGIYAQIDAAMGVWKAPANVSINNVIKTNKNITNQEQERLVVDPSGKSINTIRAFAGKGILVWGARTLAGNDNEWRYISVRRFFNFVEESVKKGTSWVVFEPNEANSWLKVKCQIENFLNNLWRDGALAGAKPDEGFFVKVGHNETMTTQDILEGRMIIEIGMAVVRPAEFIIFRFSHKMVSSSR